MRKFRSVVVVLVSAVLLSSCTIVPFGLPGMFEPDDSDQRADARMEQIAAALIGHDAAALKAMFSARALEQVPDIDERLDYLFSVLPDGGLTWEQRWAGSDGNSAAGEPEFLSASYIVFADRNEYLLSFDEFVEDGNGDEKDSDNAGIYALGAVLQTESGDSGPEVAFGSWQSLIDVEARAKGPAGIFVADSGQLSHDRMAQIVDALNRQDAAALRGMFTNFVLAEHSTDLDVGVAYLLSLFPDGDLVWDEGQGGSVIYEQVSGDSRTVLLPTFYEVSSGGVDYRLFFADFTENTIDPDNVGIYAIGAVPTAECRNCVPEAELFPWVETFDLTSGHPGVFMSPERVADTRMEQIAAALNSQDAAALKGMFSTYALKQSTEIDEGLDDLVSIFPNGGITWTREIDDTFPIDSFSQVSARRATEGMRANYKVSADGKDYRLFFANMSVNELENRENVGLVKLGVTPWTEEPSNGCFGLFIDSWTCSFDLDGRGENGYPVIYVPQ